MLFCALKQKKTDQNVYLSIEFVPLFPVLSQCSPPC